MFIEIVIFKILGFTAIAFVANHAFRYYRIKKTKNNLS
jgi:hypothetical protein